MSTNANTFESQLGKLEEICNKMNSDTLSLADGLALYEQGIRLVKALELQLKTAERKVEQLLNDDFSDKAAKPRLQLFEERDATDQPE